MLRLVFYAPPCWAKLRSKKLGLPAKAGRGGKYKAQCKYRTCFSWLQNSYITFMLTRLIYKKNLLNMFFFIFFTFFTFFLQLNVKRYQVYLVVNKISTLCLKTFKFFQLKPINCNKPNRFNIGLLQNRSVKLRIFPEYLKENFVPRCIQHLF